MFFFKQKTAYEMRISDWSSDVCSSDLVVIQDLVVALSLAAVPVHRVIETRGRSVLEMHRLAGKRAETRGDEQEPGEQFRPVFRRAQKPSRSEEHTSELQSLMRISYAVFCLQKKKHTTQSTRTQQSN